MWIDTVLVTGAAFAALPLLYVQLLPSEELGAVAFLVVPAAMLAGSITTAWGDR